MCTGVCSACMWTCMWRSGVNLGSFFSQGTLCFCFSRQPLFFCIAVPSSHRGLFSIPCLWDRVSHWPGAQDPPAPQFWGHKHTLHTWFFSPSSVEHTPFFMLAWEAHYPLSHLPAHHCFFLASLLRIHKAIYLALRRKTTTKSAAPPPNTHTNLSSVSSHFLAKAIWLGINGVLEYLTLHPSP